MYSIIEDLVLYLISSPSSSPPFSPPHLPSVSSTGDRFGRLRKRYNFLHGKGGGGEGEGAKSYDGEKTWSSLIHLLLSGPGGGRGGGEYTGAGALLCMCESEANFLSVHISYIGA
jgi:hypothetical protein